MMTGFQISHVIDLMYVNRRKKIKYTSQFQMKELVDEFWKNSIKWKKSKPKTSKQKGRQPTAT